jgi:hypothetical protein
MIDVPEHLALGCRRFRRQNSPGNPSPRAYAKRQSSPGSARHMPGDAELGLVLEQQDDVPRLGLRFEQLHSARLR